MTNTLFLKGLLPFFSLLLGALISGIAAYNAKRLVDQGNAKRALAIKLYEEFHSNEMYQCRLQAAKVLNDNPEGNLEHLYQTLPVESFSPLSRLFHWIAKVGIYEKTKQVDVPLVSELLGRYFYDWYTLHHERLTSGLLEESEFSDMMSDVKYVATKIGNPSDARYYAQRKFS